MDHHRCHPLLEIRVIRWMFLVSRRTKRIGYRGLHPEPQEVFLRLGERGCNGIGVEFSPEEEGYGGGEAINRRERDARVFARSWIAFERLEQSSGEDRKRRSHNP